jgi:hypothetical protein
MRQGVATKRTVVVRFPVGIHLQITTVCMGAHRYWRPATHPRRTAQERATRSSMRGNHAERVGSARPIRYTSR